VADIIELSSYLYHHFSSRDSGKAAVIASGAGKTVYIQFLGETETLTPAQKVNDNTYILRYRYTDLPVIIDMLRNEKPIYVIYEPTGTNNSRISTTTEPVGEGELT
jgi:hypothetical protein